MKNLKKGKYIALVSMLLLAFTLTACGSDGGDKDVVAKIDDVEISQDELNDILVERYGEETLNSIISEKIVELEVKKQDIKIDSKEIDKEFVVMEEQYGGKEGLEQAMKASNLTEKEVKEEIENKLSIKKLLKDDIAVTDEEIKAFYKENEERFIEKEQVNASHVLVEKEDLAKDIKKKLDAGEKIEDLSKEYSEDPGSKDKGGKLGFFGKGEMVKEFEEAAFSMKVGEISNPIKTENGYHVIIVNDKKEEKTTSLEENKDNIKAMLVEEKMPEAFNAWYSEKVGEYEITNNLNEAPKK